MKRFVLLAALVLAQCSGGNNNTPPYPGRLNPIAGQWTAYGGGRGIIAQLPDPFQIPDEASNKTINYVYTTPLGLAVGRTITLNYSVKGNATFAPLPEAGCGPGGCGPAQIRLFIWGRNTDTLQDRWWCNGAATPLVIGDNQVISCVIDHSWIGVGGGAQPDPSQFTAAVNNPFAMGFTFGGMFAGHGDWTTSGSATFTVNSLKVQ